MRKQQTGRRRLFATFLALTLGAGAFLYSPPTQGQYDTTLDSSDITYGESVTVYDAQMPGSYDGRYVSFDLASVSVSNTSLASGPAVEGVDYQSYANQIASELSAGAAGGRLVVDTYGVSLPLQSDTYLPVSVWGSYNGTDLGASLQYSGTVLAHTGFSTTNADISNAGSGVNLGYTSTEELDGGGGGDTDPCRACPQPELEQQQVRFNRNSGGAFRFMMAALAVAGKNYKANAKKWDADGASFTSAKVKNYRSNIPNLTDLSETSTNVDTSSVQFDAASGTFSVKHKLRIRKEKKAKNTEGAV